MQDWVEAEKDKGTSIILCTHELSHIPRLCDNFHIINQGRLVMTTRSESSGDEGVPTGRPSVDWRQDYNIHISGADEQSIKDIGDKDGLPDWQKFSQEGYLAVLGFSDYSSAGAWLTALVKRGILVTRFGDQTFLGEDELIPYFESELPE